ncbi:hypothetical protein HAX54_050913 [Datura stramonium]|uniref:Uncharacterized protein n=1 Tax=Datura stramonium TaxID=4076 RepID=A0ABS8SX53_DATST|nr:hypothetical protein [Datura stramonium]
MSNSKLLLVSMVLISLLVVRLVEADDDDNQVIVEQHVREDAVWHQGKKCAREHAALAALVVTVCPLAPLETKSFALATMT